MEKIHSRNLYHPENHYSDFVWFLCQGGFLPSICKIGGNDCWHEVWLGSASQLTSNLSWLVSQLSSVLLLPSSLLETFNLEAFCTNHISSPVFFSALLELLSISYVLLQLNALTCVPSCYLLWPKFPVFKKKKHCDCSNISGVALLISTFCLFASLQHGLFPELYQLQMSLKKHQCWVLHS